MSANKFKFVSPGVFIQETDNTGVNGSTNDLGPVIIGRSERGPALRPVKVNSFSEFVETFGYPIAGNQGGDVFRDGNYLGPTYGSYAAQAYLKSASPITFVRLLGQDNDNATVAGTAGWQTTSTTVAVSASGGGAFGLFIAPSGSGVTGTLAAVFYLDNSCSIGLSGTHVNGTASAPATCKYFANTGGSYSAPEFKLAISTSSGIVIDSKFDFSPTSENFIRKVFNTNPVLCNSTITTTTTPYWLGETFEGNLTTLASASSLVGVIMPLKSGSSSGADFRKSYQEAKTGWFIGQDLTSNTGSYVASSQQKLFRLVGRNSGEWLQKNLKVSISDIKRPTDTTNIYGTFTVVVRKLSDTDSKVESVEQFTGCNLNPFSENYICKKIGDRYETWSDTERRYIEYGDYDNLSRFVRVEMNTDVAAGSVNSEYLPFGFLGPVRFKSFTDSAAGSSYVSGAIDVFGNTVTTFISGGAGNIAFEFPTLRLRVSASEGNITDKKKAYFGIDTSWNSNKLNESVKDSVRIKPASIGDFDTSTNTEYGCVFSLDDIVSSSSGVATWVSGSRAAGTSYRSTGSYNNILDTLGVDRFTTVFNGGFDGLDIKEKEPFRNSLLTNSPTELNSYVYNSIKVAIDCLRDPEVSEFSIACMPGITNSGLQTALVDMCEQRADALAICDLAGDYTPETESTQAISARLGSVSTAVSNLRSYGLNSSYGAFYYNWIQTKDTNSGATLWVPPTVPVLGAFGYTKKVAQVWFAPAGFTRGGLTNGAGGIPVTSVRQKLTKTERDKLYDARINPIASFPAEGIVVYGQKTVKATASALDRVNVRMLTNAVKKQISRFAATLLFEPNVQQTWARFTGQAEPYLLSVKAGLGIEGYKLILDETTTTPDLIDRNIIYAKLAIWPTKSAEFFAIDVELTNNGAGFDD